MWSKSVSDDWSNPDSEHTRSSTLTWMLQTSVMNMHGSVNNLLTLLLLEQSPKTVDLLLDEGNEGTVGRMLGSKDPHSPVFPRSGPICLPRCLSPYFLAPLWFITYSVLKVSKTVQKAIWISNLGLEIYVYFKFSNVGKKCAQLFN